MNSNRFLIRRNCLIIAPGVLVNNRDIGQHRCRIPLPPLLPRRQSTDLAPSNLLLVESAQAKVGVASEGVVNQPCVPEGRGFGVSGALLPALHLPDLAVERG